MNFSQENAVYIQRDFFSDSNSIRRLFRSYAYRDVTRRFNEDEFFGQFVSGRFHRLVISNPYRDPLATSIYRRARSSGTPLLIIERGAVPGSVFLDTTGFLRDSRLYDRPHWDRPLDTAARKRLTRFKARFISGSDSLEAQPSRQAVGKLRKRLLGDKKRLCAVTLQISSDTVVRNFRDPRISYETYKHELAEMISASNEDWAFAVKSHPKEPVSTIGGVATENAVNISDLIAAADAVVTFNSGTGVAAFLHDKPVGCFGEAFYGGKGLTSTLRNGGDLTTFLATARESYDEEARARFLNHLLFRVYSEFEFLGALPVLQQRKTVAVFGRVMRVYDPDAMRVMELGRCKDTLDDILEREGERLRAWSRAAMNRLSLT